MRQPCGHVDFYPNNGKEQPGCDLTETPLPLTLIRDGIEEASRVLVACNHIRAIKLFIDSINSKCPYVAHRCDSYQHFLQVSCYYRIWMFELYLQKLFRIILFKLYARSQWVCGQKFKLFLTAQSCGSWVHVHFGYKSVLFFLCLCCLLTCSGSIPHSKSPTKIIVDLYFQSSFHLETNWMA